MATYKIEHMKEHPEEGDPLVDRATVYENVKDDRATLRELQDRAFKEMDYRNRKHIGIRVWKLEI